MIPAYQITQLGFYWSRQGEYPDAAEQQRGVLVQASGSTYTCWSLAAGANPNFIAKQMGHTDAQMVYRVYGSWMAENSQDQVLILNQKLSEFAPSMPHAVGSNGY